MLDLQPNDMCFGCGKLNECGLHLEPVFKDDHTECEIIFKPIYQGWKNMVHGGIISTVMDETMFFELQRNNINGLTYSLNVKFKHPVRIGKNYVCKSYLKKVKDKLVFLHAEMFLQSLKVAFANAVFYRMNNEALNS